MLFLSSCQVPLPHLAGPAGRSLLSASQAGKVFDGFPWLCAAVTLSGSPKIKGSIFVVPIIATTIFWGVILGPPEA